MTQAVREAIKVLFSAFPVQDNVDPKATALAYLCAVEGESPEHVEEAVRRFIQGRAQRDRHTFLPSAAELAIEVRARAEIANILSKKEKHPASGSADSRSVVRAISQEERARVGESMRALSKQLK